MGDGERVENGGTVGRLGQREKGVGGTPQKSRPKIGYWENLK